MSKGREHDERRKSQAAAARRHRNRKGFYKGDRNKEIAAYSEDLDPLAELFRLRQQYHKENLRRLFGTHPTNH